jgi:hypothetical protein
VRRGSVVMFASLIVLLFGARPARAQSDAVRFDGGRFTLLAYPTDRVLAEALLRAAQGTDSFPGLPRPARRVVIAVAPTDAVFREWVGDAFPEWGAAAAFPATHRIVMRGRSAGGSSSGDPLVVLRHELAHLALAEALGELPPRWFDEGYASYAAGEWGRDEVLATNFALVRRGARSFAALDAMFAGGGTAATGAYALSHRAVAELAALDPARGLSLFFRYWGETGSLDRAVRQAYGLTLDGFEAHWVSRTRRRYGALALMGDLALAAGVVSLVLVPMYVQRRRRDQRRLMALRTAEEEQERRARESALESLLATVPVPEGRRSLDTPSDDP